MTQKDFLVRVLDPRLKLLLAAAMGLAVWQAGWTGLGLYAGILAWSLWVLRRRLPAQGAILWAYAGFVLVWTAIKLAAGLIEGAGTGAVEPALWLGARLLVLLALGLALAASASAPVLGRAACWFLGPVLGRSAWKAALSVSLMIHFLPQVLATIASVRLGLGNRCPGLAWRKGMVIAPLAVMRLLSQKTWSRTLAVAGRGLDDPEAWKTGFAASWRQWLGGVLVLAAVVLSAMV